MTVDVTRFALRLGGGKPRVQQFATASGVPLSDANDGPPATWPTPSRDTAGHAVVLAGSGAGKTVLLAAALLDEYLAAVRGDGDGGESLVLLDCKGDLIAAFLAGLCAQAPECLENVAFLNPFGAEAFGFNPNRQPPGSTPIDIRASQLASLVSQVSTATGAQRHLGAGSRQLDVLQNVILGALSSDHAAANPTWCLDSLSLPGGLAMLAKLARSERAKAFLLNTTLGDELRTSCAARLRVAFASCEQLERVVAAPTCLDLRALTGPRNVVLIDLGSPFGGIEALTAFWANLLVRQLADILLERRSPWAGHHTRLVIDEAQIAAPVLADIAERILTTGRSRGISLVTLSQGTTLIDAASPTLLRVLLTNASTKIIGRLAVADSELLAREQSPRSGIDESLSALRGRFTTAVTNLPNREFFLLQPGGRVRFRSRSVDLNAWNVARLEHEPEVAACLARHGLPDNLPPRVSLAEAARAAPGEVRQRNGSTSRRPRTPWG